jgi:hypothetical protein
MNIGFKRHAVEARPRSEFEFCRFFLFVCALFKMSASSKRLRVPDTFAHVITDGQAAVGMRCWVAGVDANRSPRLTLEHTSSDLRFRVELAAR